MRYFNVKKIAIFAVAVLFFYGCKNGSFEELIREEKFTLNYGSFENELNLFNLNTSYPRPDTQIFMKDGLFYIANSGGQKILKLSSFGDLLTFFYNPETNLKPFFLETETEETDKKNGTENSGEERKETAAATRNATAYPLNHPCLLTVTNTKHIFAVDSIPDEKTEYDYEENLALREIILHFDEEGNFLDSIGQDGAGGIPFPAIDGIYTNAKNELIVICRTQTSLKVYWYDNSGFLLYKIPVFLNALPAPVYAETETFFSSVDKIIPDFNEPGLYVKIDYYAEEKDPATQASLGVMYDKSCLYFLNLKTGKYDRKIDLDFYEETESLNGENKKFKKVYELAGVTENGWCYLSTPIESGYAFELIDLKSQKKYKRNLTVENSEMMYNAFHISSKGIISALLASEDKAAVVWWRADKIIGITN